MNQGTLTSATIKLDEEILSHFEINFVTVVVVDVDADVDVDVFVDTYCHLRDQSQISIIIHDQIQRRGELGVSYL